MDRGISTSCFYPEQLRSAVCRLAERPPEVVEVFLNTYRETTPDFAHWVRDTLDAAGIRAVSVHPFTCPVETMLFFSEYEGRLEDALERYRELYFDFMHIVGAKILVLHGCMNHARVEEECYFERYARMREFARQEGIVLAQENVAPFKSHSVDFIRNMKRYLGNEVEFVLDIKQAVRAGEDVWAMLDAMGSRIVHTHVSDHREGFDCLPVGDGVFDFALYFRRLRSYGFSGSAVIELYRQNYRTAEDLFQAYDKLLALSV